MKFYRVGVCLRARQEAPYTAELISSLEAAAEAVDGMQLFSVEASPLDELSSQRQAVLSFVQGKFNLVVIDAADSEECEPLAAILDEARIPVLFVNTRPKGENSADARRHFVGFDLFRGGFETAKHLAEVLPHNGKVIVLDGGASQQSKGFVAGAKSLMTVEAVLSADHDELKTRDLLRDYLARNKGLSAIFAAGDDMALAAAAFLQDAGRSDVLIAGFDSNLAGKTALRRQTLACSANREVAILSQAVVESAAAILGGVKSVVDILVPMELLTAELFAREDRYVERRPAVVVRPEPDLSELDYGALADGTQYPVVLGGSFVSDLAPRLNAIGAANHFVVVDENVHQLYGDRLVQALGAVGGEVELTPAAVKSGEGIFAPLNDLLSRLIDRGMTIGSCLTLVGGASLIGAGAMAASVFGRGIKIVLVPTTPLSQIDCVSLAGMELCGLRGITLVGQPYDPSMIFIDGEFVRSLPIAVQRAGFVEAARAGLLRHPPLLSSLESGSYGSILIETLAVKTRGGSSDRGAVPAVGLYAEPLARAIEFAAADSLSRVESLSLAMIACSEISICMGFAKPELRRRHEQSLGGIGLPLSLLRDEYVELVIDRLYLDRKERKTHIAMLLLEEPGRPHILNGKRLIPVSEKIVRQALQSLAANNSLAKAV